MVVVVLPLLRLVMRVVVVAAVDERVGVVGWALHRLLLCTQLLLPTPSA